MIINMNGAKAPETPSPVLQEKTVTPETLPVVIGADEGYTGLSQVTVNPDSQLKAENIRSGKTIFGVGGTFEGVNTGDALSNTELISYIESYASFGYVFIRPMNDYILSFVSDTEPDISSDYIRSSGVRYNSHTAITTYSSPLNVKQSYGVFKSDVYTSLSTTTLNSKNFTGKVSGSFNREYTGSPIYTGLPLDILRFSEMEFGIYEYNIHISGVFTITASFYTPNEFIKVTDGFPMEFEGDIVVKYKNSNSSTDSGVIDIQGFPDVSFENVTVGTPYSSLSSEHYLLFLVKTMYFNALPTKVE